MRQNLLQMTRRFHCKFELLSNLKLDRQNRKFHLRRRGTVGILVADFMSCRRSVLQERDNWRRLKSLTTAKKFQLNQKLSFEELSAGFANEDSRSGGGSARRQ